MRVLIVKTSSLGDVVHTLPAVTDALKALPNVRFDWVVEEAFAEIPAWHQGVDRVIPVALRRWRKDRKAAMQSGEWPCFLDRLTEREYDLVIDAQGLLKSAWLASKAKGPRHGFSWSSARESMASLSYSNRHKVAWNQHAVSRVRDLFGMALGYRPERGLPDYGLQRESFQPHHAHGKELLFFHGTTWVTKHYPEAYWRALLEMAVAEGYEVRLPWGSQAEKARAERLQQGLDAVRVLPKCNLGELATILAGVVGVVSVDTGLSHLAAALGIPQVCLYGATDPARTGAYGRGQFHLKSDLPCSPCLKRGCHYTGPAQQQPGCYDSIGPMVAWSALLDQIP